MFVVIHDLDEKVLNWMLICLLKAVISLHRLNWLEEAVQPKLPPEKMLTWQMNLQMISSKTLQRGWNRFIQLSHDKKNILSNSDSTNNFPCLIWSQSLKKWIKFTHSFITFFFQFPKNVQLIKCELIYSLIFVNYSLWNENRQSSLQKWVCKFTPKCLNEIDY
jgi:hypothetical protein